MGDIVYTLTNRRWNEKCVVYVESHDQALAGDKTITFQLMDKDMYDFMALDGLQHLNFMGNEFGHPEWIDFPREGNNNNFDKCRHRFDLGDASYLRYKGLQEFDCAMQLLEEKYGLMLSEHEYISRKDGGDKVIVFEKGELFKVHGLGQFMALLRIC